MSSRQKQYENDGQLTCDICLKTYKYRARYEKHMETHMPGQNLELLKCKHCEEYFQSRTQLRKHQLTHEDLYCFKCSECGKVLKSEAHLNHHRSTHFKQQKFACCVCGKQFGSYSSVQTHQRKATLCHKEIQLAKKSNQQQHVLFETLEARPDMINDDLKLINMSMNTNPML